MISLSVLIPRAFLYRRFQNSWEAGFSCIQRIDCAIQWMNHSWTSTTKIYWGIQGIVIYPLDGTINPLNYWNLVVMALHHEVSAVSTSQNSMWSNCRIPGHFWTKCHCLAVFSQLSWSTDRSQLQRTDSCTDLPNSWELWRAKYNW